MNTFKHNLHLIVQYAKLWLKSQLIYKTSFILLCIGQFFVPFFVFLGAYLLFDQFKTLDGWAFSEVALLYGTIHIAFALSESIVRGFDSFSSLVVSGDFDRILVRPVSTVVQVVGSKFEFTRIGRLIQGTIIFIWAITHIAVQWTFLKMFTVFFMIIGGVFIMSGLFIIFATMSFWTIQGLEFANIFTDGGREMSQYPISIYAKPIRKFFTFVVPFAAVNIYPLRYLLDQPGYTSHLYAFMPLAAVLFIIPALMIWSFGVKHYKSTGS